MSVIINDKKFNAEYLKTPEELERGMMGREELNGCMVFMVDKGHHKFWMKNCKIPLDIVFVLNNRINKIHPNCEPCNGECEKTYSGIGDHVIEFPSGIANDFKIGDKVRFNPNIPYKSI